MPSSRRHEASRRERAADNLRTVRGQSGCLGRLCHREAEGCTIGDTPLSRIVSMMNVHVVPSKGPLLQLLLQLLLRHRATLHPDAMVC